MPPGDPTTDSREPESGEFDSLLRRVGHAGESPVLPPDSIAVGDRLGGGRFTIRALLGRGGMGSVWRAWDARDRRAVALKTLRSWEASRLVGLKREFRALADLRHRNLVELYELHADGPHWFFTLALIDGVNFLDSARPGGLLDPERARAALAELADGLAFLHGADLVHRDVKPSNILVEPGGRVVLLDFGLVTEKRAQAAQPERLLGTPAYMSPEQAKGGGATPAADLYSVGVMLFEALSGELPPAPPGTLERVPGPGDLAELCAALCHPEPARRPSAAELARTLRGGEMVPVRAPRDGEILIGRELELDRLDEALASAPKGATVVDLLGESGIGKSALLRQFARRARAGGARVFWGRCREREVVPFNAVDPIIDELAPSAKAIGDAEALAALGALFPALAPERGEAPGAPAKPPQGSQAADANATRRLGFAALARVLAEVAADAPLVLVIDDAHWADGDSAALLEAVLRAPETRMLLVVARRAGTGDPLAIPERCRRVSLELGPLTRADAIELASRLMNQDGAGAGEPEAIARESGGHALFVRELARRPRRVSGEPKLDSVLGARLAELDPDSLELLELTAVAATPLTRDTLIEALPGAAAALDHLTRDRLLRPAGRRDQGFEPYHDVIRELVSRHLSASAAAERHRCLAEALEHTDPDRVEALAHHWRLAGERERALGYVLGAAERAGAALAFDRAAALYRRAIELGEDSVDLYEKLGAALESAGRSAGSAAAYRRAADKLRANAGDAAGRVDRLERLAAEQLLRSGDIDGGLDAAGAVLERAGIRVPSSPRRLLAAVMIERARLGVTREPRSPRPLSPKARHELESAWAFAVGMSQVDPIRRALFQARHLRLALKSGDPAQIALGLCVEAPPAAAGGLPARRAHALLDRARALTARAREPLVPAYLELAEAEVAFLCGEFARARDHAERAAARFSTCVGAWWERVTAREFHLACLWHTGRIAELRAGAETAYEAARQRGDRYALTQLQTTVLPPLYLLADRPARAEHALDEAARTWSRREMWLQNWQHMQATALLHLYCGEPVRALFEIESRWRGRGRWVLARVSAVRVFTAFVHGTAAAGALARGKGGRSLARRLDRDIRVLAGTRGAGAVTALLRAQRARLRDDPEAPRLLGEAAEALDGADHPHIAACARLLLGQRDRADAYFARQPIVSPEKVARMLIPGWSP